jgi:hypothetical protein
VPLSSGQARITTFELDSVAEIDRMVAQIKRDDSDVRERTLTNRSADKHTCETIREISSLFEFGPGSHEQNIPPSYERNVHLFCRIGTRAFVTYLWYSPEDRVGKRYANAALAIMGSLKIAKP